MENLTYKEGRTTAIISYITFVGTIIAIFMNLEPKNDFARFHIRQALGINILYFLLVYSVSLLNSFYASFAFWIFVFVLWIYGFLGAVQLRKTVIPFFGNLFQKWFTFIQ